MTCAHGVVLVEAPQGLAPSANCMECLREQTEAQQRAIEQCVAAPREAAPRPYGAQR